MKFTDREIKGFAPRGKTYDKREGTGNGFAVRVFPSGVKTFIFFYHFEGRKRRMTLGSYSQCSLERAHRLHREALR